MFKLGLAKSIHHARVLIRQRHPVRFTFTIFSIKLVNSFNVIIVLSVSVVRSWLFSRSSSVSTRWSRLLVVEDRPREEDERHEGIRRRGCWLGWRRVNRNCFVFAMSLNDCYRLRWIVAHEDIIQTFWVDLRMFSEYVFKLCWSVVNKWCTAEEMFLLDQYTNSKLCRRLTSEDTNSFHIQHGLWTHRNY